MVSSPSNNHDQAPLLAGYEDGTITSSAPISAPSDSDGRSTPAKVTYSLYFSHFLSTWNSRVFEFGSVLYLAAIFPDTLLPMSVYALSRGVSAVLLSPLVGQLVDTGNRLRVVRFSIVLQRLAVATSCFVFYLVAAWPIALPMQNSLLVVLALLASVEKVSALLNLVAVERDWVVVIATDQPALRRINAQMRRIDLGCKLAGPLFIASIDSYATKAAIIVNLLMNLVSVMAEYPSIGKVYNEVPDLQKPKGVSRDTTLEPSTLSGSPAVPSQSSRGLSKSLQDIRLYFDHPAFLPSFGCSLLYFTVLSFSGQMITCLLSVGYTATQISIMRTLAVIFEVLATWAGPWLMGTIGTIRAGLWLLSTQTLSLAAGVALFMVYSDNPIFATAGLVGGVILSRVGLRGFDLCAQIIVQEEVEAEHRGAFSSVEAAWQNVFELCSYASTIVFSQPDEFRWPALASVGAVGCAWVLYTVFVYSRRGHLVHLPACISSEKDHRTPEALTA